MGNSKKKIDTPSRPGSKIEVFLINFNEFQTEVIHRVFNDKPWVGVTTIRGKYYHLFYLGKYVLNK